MYCTSIQYTPTASMSSAPHPLIAREPSAAETADWCAIAAHALAHRFPHVPPAQLDEVALELHREPRMRALPAARAVQAWLAPVLDDEAAA